MTFYKLRKEMGLSMVEFAARYNISLPSVYHYSAGTYPTIKIIQKIYHHPRSKKFQKQILEWSVVMIKEK